AELLGHLPQRLDEVDLADLAGARIDLHRRFGPAIRTHQRLFGWRPDGLAAAGRTGVLVERLDAPFGGGLVGSRAFVAHPRIQSARKASRSARLIRTAEPILRALRSPESTIARTSASLTPRASATWAGVISSGNPVAAAAACAPVSAGEAGAATLGLVID